MKDAIQAAVTAAMNKTLPPELFSGLLAIAADAVIAVDEEQRIIFFNEGAERIFGWRAAEIGGQRLEVLLPERFRATHEGHVQRFGEAHGRARLMGDRQQISGLRKNGEEFPAEAAIQRVEVSGGSIYATVLRDISARQRAEDALHQAIHARDDMIGIVSHDLRNPANAVKMLVKSILGGSARHLIPADVADRLRIVHQAAEQMDALIQDLLDMTRMEGGALTVSAKAVDADWLVARSVEALRPLAEAAQVSLATSLDEEPLTLLVDPDRVLQLLSNVVGNAIKFTPAGGSVSLSVHATPDGALFAVKDTGIGIAGAQLERVFDRFTQLPSAHGLGPRHGAGLGLPISRGIVEAHGGRIWIESQTGNGTLVQFLLPASLDGG